MGTSRWHFVAEGFYEWAKVPVGKQPIYIRMRDGRQFAFAGLRDRWHEGERRVESFTIVTVQPNEVCAKVHDRMPLILREEDLTVWLDPETSAKQLTALLKPYHADQMESFPVSRLVNSPRNEVVECVSWVRACGGSIGLCFWAESRSFRALGCFTHAHPAQLFVVAGAIALALVLFVLFSSWSRRFGARAVERWATAKGLQVASARRRSFVPHWRSLSARQFQFFRVTVRDRDGERYKAWLRLESDCTDPQVLDVIWDDKEPPGLTTLEPRWTDLR
jgi:hypothetical protein